VNINVVRVALKQFEDYRQGRLPIAIETASQTPTFAELGILSKKICTLTQLWNFDWWTIWM